MSEISRLSAEAGLRVANVFHAGDGNLHPLVLYDRRIPGQEDTAEALSAKILDLFARRRKRAPSPAKHGVGQDKKYAIASKMFRRTRRSNHHATRPLRL